jgi:4-azaleucine resistance transporter AzlC
MMSEAATGSIHPVRDLRTAARDAGVIWLGLFALGIGFGVLVTSHGFPWWLAPLISGLMFAGSVEFILVGMLAVGAPIAAIALTTFLINSRHLFYGLSFPLNRVNGRLAKAYSVFALCDEAYALTTSKDPDTLTSRGVLWTQIGLQSSWAAGALAGGVVGSTLLGGLDGLDFILTALFIVLTIDAYRAAPDNLTLSAWPAGQGWWHLLWHPDRCCSSQ